MASAAAEQLCTDFLLSMWGVCVLIIQRVGDEPDSPSGELSLACMAYFLPLLLLEGSPVGFGICSY